MSELSTSFSSNQKATIKIYSDKKNPIIKEKFTKIKNYLKLQKYSEAKKYINLISLYNTLSTIEHLNLYF